MDDLTLARTTLRQNLDELETINTWLGGYEPVLDALARLRPACRAAAPCAWPTWAAAAATPFGTWPAGRAKTASAVELDGHRRQPVYAGLRGGQKPGLPRNQLTSNSTFSRRNFSGAALRCAHVQLVLPPLHATTSWWALLRQWRPAGAGGGRSSTTCTGTGWPTTASGGSRGCWAASYLVRHDAPLSVARRVPAAGLGGKLLARAGITHYELRWRWAFRWQDFGVGGPVAESKPSASFHHGISPTSRAATRNVLAWASTMSLMRSE
ncbi:MAG: SAM-dependent methyltransferase [Hymenobacter sp.]